MSRKNIAIIGAGLSGLVLAEELADYCNITLFEKARGIGGRMSTRYTDDFQFDHGAQFFTARSKDFQKFLKPFMNQNLVQEWNPRVVTLEAGQKAYKRDWFEPHYVAVPKMNMLCKAIAKRHDVKIKTKIDGLKQDAKKWFLSEENGQSYGPFDWVISTAPAPQATDLLPTEFSGHATISNVKMQGCYSLMLGFSDKLSLNWDAAKVKNSPIGWMTFNSSKPLRDSNYSLLVQTTNDWAEAHIENDQEDVQDILLREAELLLEFDVKNAKYISLHRWRYANTLSSKNAEQDQYFIDDTLELAACGDWCVKGHVESAYLSAKYLAQALKNRL